MNEVVLEYLVGAVDILLRGNGPDDRSRADSGLPFISVVMPIYNRAGMARLALESLRHQTYRDFELIAVDDGSDDDTPDLLAAWEAREPWVKVVTSDARGGHSAARNRGLAIAKGEVITYLDSDNEYYPNALQVIAEAFAHPEQECIFTSHVWIDEGGRVEVRCPHPTLEDLVVGRSGFDLNAFAHRRKLYEALGGFDEGMRRLVDLDLYVRYCRVVMARRIPLPTGRYGHGSWPRVSNSELLHYNAYLFEQKHKRQLATSLRVLYLVHSYPQVSETYIVAEFRFMMSRGVHVEIWSETNAEIPDTDLLASSEVVVHRGSLADAIAASRPDVLHFHWMNAFDRNAAVVTAAGLPVTIRGHSFDFSSDTLARLQQHSDVRKIYVFPTQNDALPTEREKLKLVPVSFHPGQYPPSQEKDRKLVMRTGVALPTKDVESFIEVAARCPSHRFVLFTCRVLGNPGYLDQVLAANEAKGSPVDIRLDRPASEVATWMARAGIYLHAHNVETARFGMPISIAEAMATGAYVLAKRSVGGAIYLGRHDRLYATEDDAAALINATLGWDEQRWRAEWQFSVERAYADFAPDKAALAILDDWMGLMGTRLLAERAASRLQHVAPNERVCFGAGNIGRELLRIGFHEGEDWGVWAGGSISTLAFVCGDGEWSDVETLTFDLSQFADLEPPDVILNGRRLGRLAADAPSGTYCVAVEDSHFKKGDLISLVLSTSPPQSPRDFGLPDSRLLTYGLRSMTFSTRPS